jgi:iron complex outermembrane recepter protein
MALDEPPPSPPPAGEQVEELIVTAERRESSLQNVPVTVTALPAAALEGSNITSIEGLTTKVPGLLMTQTLNASQPYMRGVGAENTVPGTEASVATYVDGVYVASITGSLFGLNNVKRIEVLRGPQGTLFGRNATGGLVQVITADPSYDPQGNVSVSYGTFDTWTGDACVTGPLSKTLAADFAVSGVNQGEGYGRNGNEVYKRRELNGRTKLRFTPADNLTATLAVDYGAQDGECRSTRSIAPGTVAFGGFRPTANPYDTISAGGPLGTKAQGGASLKIEYQFGGVNLTSLTASRSYLSRFDFDQANIPLALAQAYFHDPERTWQQEFVLQGSKPRLDWTAGAIYFGLDKWVNAKRLGFTQLTERSRRQLLFGFGLTRLLGTKTINSDWVTALVVRSDV